MTPYYSDDTVTLFLGDMREVIPGLGIEPDLVVADAPYQETSLVWDRWPDGWPALVATVASSLWCFGSMRTFLDRRDEFGDWRLSQDVVWRKPTGSGVAADRLRRVHEHATHWYRGKWDQVYHQTPRVHVGIRRPAAPTAKQGRDMRYHQGKINQGTWVDDGTRFVQSVIEAPNLRGRAIHPTEKPVELLRPLIEYACPPGGLILDPFAGSCATAVAARLTGRRAVLIEADEAMCERAVRARLAQDVLPLEVA